MYLFDTSVWIDFFKAKTSPQTNLLEEHLKNDLPICICPPIIQEILQGVKNDYQFEQLKDQLLALNMLEYNVLQLSLSAAQLYRACRQQGLTVRKSLDCLIAAYAIRANVPLVHQDTDFDLIGRLGTLKIYKP